MDRERFLRTIKRSISDDDLDRVLHGKIERLLTVANTKTMKGEKKGYLSAILHLSPSDRSGFNVCPLASKGCRAACLNTAGRGRFDATQAARRRKTHWYFARREEFLEQLVKEVDKHVRAAVRKSLIPCVRLNGTSDIPWEKTGVLDAHPGVQFYDYTKVPGRPLDIPNYHLTFSLAESNAEHARAELERGCNVAAVFRDRPATFWDHPVVDGDESDLRFLDPQGVVVGLTAKGEARTDTSGFVQL
jgi:hypothetical protein